MKNKSCTESPAHEHKMRMQQQSNVS